ncbi:hypothetical protein NSZ01_18630 [Nocardioides szechwanensis]|uniref:Uncharacterized protein n=1 Tax=Nocardioides szechwanensis TaxID=1005944 RepID=A0A1H0GXD4_9ACTN|nr:hypothetical protein [Nocardioides szechwanensis]GEP34095.1 hypothetical protein NSZ01_18630 [Nocardioides szechwanensis]SDO11454.1 hypothetical protein SAMN05192576_3375 [Nocardioides szechwanensis]
MTRWPASILAGLLCALTVLTAAPASAAKSWPPLVVSRSGEVWTPNLTRPLFRESVRWVPGDSSSRTFYARNQSGQKARLGIVVDVTDGSRWLCCGHLRLAIAIDGRWRPIAFAQSTGVGRLVLNPGDVVPVTVQFRLLGPAAAAAMARSLTFSLNLRLTELPAPRAA